MRTARVIFALVILFVAVPAWADVQAGVDAYEKGDYATALKEWRPLAEQGDADAQYNLGWMYEKSFGVPQDDKEAVRWYRLAAEQGIGHAQYRLGGMYTLGRGVPQDFVLSHMWLNLAAALGDEQARTLRDKLAKQLTPAQLDDAQRLAREWKAKSEQTEAGGRQP